MNNKIYIIVIALAVLCRVHLFANPTDSLLKNAITMENIVYESKIAQDSITTWTHDIICNGDTIAYSKIIHHVPYYDFLHYSIHLANEYNYAKAYYNAYRILDIWYHLHDCEMDSTSWADIRFWLGWGAEAGNTSCSKILNEGYNISEQIMKKLDSINSFVFVLPIKNIKNNKIYATALDSNPISMSYTQFIQYRKLAVQQGILDYYIVINDYAMGKSQEFCYREELLYEISRIIKWKQHHEYDTSILWRLDEVYMMCGKINRRRIGTNIHYSRLGYYVLEKGYQDGDSYAIMPLAELYYKGIQTPQNKSHAQQLLSEKFSPKTAANLMRRWDKEMTNQK